MSEHDVFLAAIEIDDLKERAAYLANACNGNAALRQQVDSLLAAHEQSGEFLDVPALRQMAGDPAPGVTSIEAKSAQGEIDLSFLEPSTAADSLGRLLHYEVRQVIGRGGCGIVLKAFDEKLERIVAIKVMAPELAATSPARKRFLREARATAAIRHENVVSIHAVEEQPLPFLVMEYIAGETLQQRLDRTGPLDVRDLLRIGRQVASGLAAAHAQGLIHRDTKPANILLEDGTNHLKITDFGLARSADDASMTQSGVIAGTPLYMSPEQAQALDIDHRSDLFSLGSVLYVMCSGRPPFRAASSIAVLRRVVEEQPRPIQTIIPEVPDWLVAVITKLHAKNPAERFASAQEVCDLLGRCLTELEQRGRVDLANEIHPIEASLIGDEPTSSLPEKVPAAPRHRHWIAAAALVLAAVTGLGMAEATGVTNVRSTVIRLFSPGGTLIVEVDDPGVSVSIDGEEMVITGTGANEIRLKPGQYTLLARKDGRVVREELVTVTTNGRQVVRVSKISEGKPDEGIADADRKAAEYVLSVGSYVRINGQENDIKSLRDLPEGRFRLTDVALQDNRQTDAAGLTVFQNTTNIRTLNLCATAGVDDDTLARFANNKNLDELHLWGVKISGRGLAHFKNCRSLRVFGLGDVRLTDKDMLFFRDFAGLKVITCFLLRGADVGDEGIANLKGAEQIQQLTLSHTKLTDAGLKTFEGHKKVIWFSLDGTAVSDEGLSALYECSGLRSINLQNTKVTAAGVERLKKALPLCHIEWDGGSVEPVKPGAQTKR